MGNTGSAAKTAGEAVRQYPKTASKVTPLTSPQVVKKALSPLITAVSFKHLLTQAALAGSHPNSHPDSHPNHPRRLNKATHRNLSGTTVIEAVNNIFVYHVAAIFDYTVGRKCRGWTHTTYGGTYTTSDYPS